LKKQLSAVLFWSVISAAFIGPGTVTTAASAGAQFGLDLIWVLALSTIACVVLQVNVTLLTINSEKTLGELLLLQFKNLPIVPVFLGLSIVFGCAAYQAGNLLGATLGVAITTQLEQKLVLLVIVVMASLMLWFGTIRLVIKVLGVIVAVMGFVFVAIAISMQVEILDIIRHSVLPRVPAGSEILIMGLVGTTVVPYNLFLGSGLSKGHQSGVATIGLVLAITLGGIISIAILVVGTLVSGSFGFDALSGELENSIGSWSHILLGVGLFAAGFTSSITAPIAAVYTMQSVMPYKKSLSNKKSLAYRLIWMIVMGAGLIFGLLDLQPIPAIILAQAINGILLPFIIMFILYVVISERMNDSRAILLKGSILSVVVGVIASISIFNLFKIFMDANLTHISLAILLGFMITAGVVLLAIFVSNTKG